jgi:hypothetical protein
VIINEINLDANNLKKMVTNTKKVELYNLKHEYSFKKLNLKKEKKKIHDVFQQMDEHIPYEEIFNKYEKT